MSFFPQTLLDQKFRTHYIVLLQNCRLHKKIRDSAAVDKFGREKGRGVVLSEMQSGMVVNCIVVAGSACIYVRPTDTINIVLTKQVFVIAIELCCSSRYLYNGQLGVDGH